MSPHIYKTIEGPTVNSNILKCVGALLLMLANTAAQPNSLQTYTPLLLWSSPSNSVSALYMIDSPSHVTNYLFGTDHGFAFGSPVWLGGDLNAGSWAIRGSVIDERHEWILSNGINKDVVCGTSSFIDVLGPTGSFSIQGISGGEDGKTVEIFNLTGQNMTIAVENGATGNDPVATNRIISMSGSDQTTVGNGFARLKYNSRIGRWVLTDFNP